jgi:hypothetical protein
VACTDASFAATDKLQSISGWVVHLNAAETTEAALKATLDATKALQTYQN